MTAQELKNSILQLAIQGKLVKQDLNDEPASVLLEKIKEEREKLIKEKKIKKEKYSEIYKDSSDNHYYEKFDDGTINNITDEIPFDIPDNWAWTRLKNLSSLISDGTHKTPNYVSNGIPFISVKDISSGFLNFENTKFITKEEHFQLIKRCKPEKDDLLICRIGTLGKAIKINIDNEFSIFVSLGLIKLIYKEIADYLVYVINSVYGFNWIEKNKVGGGTHTFKINLEDLKEMILPFPPVKEQNKIVEKTKHYISYIDKYETIHKKLENLNNTYKEELKKSILQYAIQGKLVKQDINDESAEILINRILDEKRALMKTKQIKKENLSIIYKDNTDNQFYEKFDDGKIINITDEIPFDIPNNWCWTRINNIGNVIGGGTPKTDIRENWTNATIPWLTPADMKNIKGKFAERGKRNISEIGLKNSSATLMPKGTILYSSRAPIGYIAIANNEITTNQGFKSVILIDMKLNEFLYYELIERTPSIISKASGTTFKEISGSEFGKILVAIPPYNEQIKIIAKLECLFDKIKTAD